jgi:hypothetical protein
MTQESKEALHLEATLLEMLLVLARAYEDPARPKIRISGMDERDLAFESGLVEPSEMELSIYGTQKRGRILKLIGEMEERNWIGTELLPPEGAYHVVLKPIGLQRIRESKEHSIIPSLWSQMIALLHKANRPKK